MTSFVHSFDNKPLITAKDFYEAQCDLAKLFFDLLKPTFEEIVAINYEVIDIGIEDLLCDPTDPKAGGDVGLLASLVYEHRNLVEEEKKES
jgi:hypothetical protein